MALDKQNLTKRIYESIRSDILAGKYQYQESLPSIAKLCEAQDAGRNTIRSVLSLLEEEQLIFQEKGKNAVVVFNLVDRSDQALFIRQLCGKAPFMEAVFDTMRWILPDISQECIKRATPAQMLCLKEKIQSLKTRDLSSDRLFLDALIDIYSYVLSFLGNDSLLDMFLSLTQFVFVGVPKETQNKAKLEKVEKYAQKMIGGLFEFIMMGNLTMMKKSLEVLLSTFGKTTMQLINRYEHIDPQAPQIPFTWKRKRTRDYLYVSIASDIIKDIMDGSYQYGDSFLSIEELAQKYHVSTRTSRKVLEVLKEYHIVHTVNGLGSFIHLDIDHGIQQPIYDQNIQIHVSEYCQALQLLTICLRGVEKPYFKQLSEEALEEVMFELQLEQTVDVSALVKAIFQQNDCLSTIYRELNLDLQWALCICSVYPIQEVPFDFQSKKQALMMSLKQRRYKKSCNILNEIMEQYHLHAITAAEKISQHL